VTSNLDDPAFIMENNTNGANNYINIKLKGKGYNTAGLNAKLRIYYDNGKMQHHEMKNARGFQSSSEPLMHFGLGNAAELDSVVVYWHTGNTTVLRGIKANQTLEIEEDRSMAKRSLATLSKNVLKAAEGAIQPRFRHQEKPYNDYQKQVLLPHKFSQQGPFLSKADVNGDDLEDFYVSGAAGQGGALYLQQSDGSFKKKTQSIFEKHKAYEDMQSLFVDVDGDLDMDLYVVSGSSEFAPKSNLFQDRLYINDGKGNMKHAVDALPPIQSSGTAVTSTDLDGDGDQDIFVGGGIFPDHYPYSSASFLLMNEGGKFVNIAQAAGVDLIGMVSDAEFTDYNGDGYDDLMVVGEWMNITFFRNDKGKGFTNVTEELGLGKTNGFWNTIEPIDIDADGDLDYLVGNVGLNYKFTASAERPFSIYSGDFDSNGTYDVFLAKIDGGKEVPIRGRECTSEQMPIISDRFKTYNAFADADMSQIIGNKTQGSIKYQAFQFASVMIKNEGNRFTVSELPRTAQISSVNAIAQIDLDGDQTKEIVLAGNKYQTEAETSRLDASIGMILEYDSDGSWKAYEPSKYGYELGGDVKDMAVFEQDGKARLIKASNDEILTIYDIVKSN